MARVLLAFLTGHLSLHVIDCTHDSKVTYSIKKAEWETAWEQSYRSNSLISVVV